MSWYRREFLRIEDTPSGMTAEADFGRSMVMRRDECRRILRGKLWHLENGVEKMEATDAQRAIAARILGRI